MLKQQYGSFEIQSQSMKSVLAKIEANRDKKFFIIAGEAGTGKTTTLQFVHQSVFANRPMCLIDDGRELPFEVDSAIIACSPEQTLNYLKQMDLSQTCVLELPRLADRKADLAPFAQFFLQVLSLMNNKKMLKLTDKALEKLLQYDWKGHFYELETVLEEAYQAAVLDSARPAIEPEHIRIDLAPADQQFSVGQKLDEVERKYILQTLYFVHQNRTKAAEILGISIRTLRNKINQYRQEGYL